MLAPFAYDKQVKLQAISQDIRMNSRSIFLIFATCFRDTKHDNLTANLKKKKKVKAERHTSISYRWKSGFFFFFSSSLHLKG